MRVFLIAAAIAGTVVPWWFFAGFIADNGIGLPAFVGGLFANGAAGGFSADLLISSFVFWVWSFLDARQHGVRHWLVVIPANLLVGLSLALPLYLWMRAGKQG
jgi:hypothetical protein